MTIQKLHKSEARPPAGPNTLELVNVTKRFGAVAALEQVNLVVPKGQFVTILGPSGSGKTTMLRLLAGFDIPTSGEIFLTGRNVAPLPPSQRGIGMVFQNYALFPHMTVRDNIGYGLKIRRWDHGDRKKRIDEMLDLVQLQGKGHRKPKELSGGQQQRVALVRALAPRPALLLMDEPLGALDRALRFEMAEEIRRLHRTLGTTTVYVTHDREEALTLSDRILIMRDGHIIADGTPEELYTKPTSAFVAGFFGGHNIVGLDDIEADTGVEAGSLDHRRAAAGARIAVPVRKFTLKRPENSDFISLRVKVLEALFFGDYVRATCRSERSGAVVTAWIDPDDRHQLKTDAIVDLFSRKQDCVVVDLGK